MYRRQAKDPSALHPVQAAMVERGGSQCGYCTPGFVVSMFAEFYRDGRVEGEPDLESIGGNLCRCTGYRPIREALVSLRTPSDADPHQQRLASPALEVPSLRTEHAGVRFDRPTTLAELFDLLEASPDAKLVGGGTDVVVEVNQMDRRFDHLVALDAIGELRGFEETADALVLGAGEPLAPLVVELRERLAEDAFYRKWWFWTLVGVVVVGAAVGIGIAVRGGENAPNGTLPPFRVELP